MQKNDFIIIYCTVPDKNVAMNIANNLVQNKLASCVNIIDNITSIYHWEGNIENDNELLLVIKSKNILYNEIEKNIKKLHPYSVPEIISVPIISGSTEYLNWIEDSVL